MHYGGYKYSILMRLVSLIGVITLCNYRNGPALNDHPYYVFMSMINFDLCYMSQGMIDKIYHKE